VAKLLYPIVAMSDVFISYPHEAKEQASLLANALQGKGVSTWFAEKDLSSDADWKRSIRDALRSAGAVVFLVDPRWEASLWMQEEYMQALDSYWAGTTKFLVALLVGAKAEPPTFLRQWKSVRVENKADWDRAASLLAEWIQQDQHVRNEPTKKEKQELDQRLSAITKVAHQWQSSSSQTRKIKPSSYQGDNAVFRSSRTGEFRQRGSKKSRPSKAK
jgi:TIR domain